VSKRTVRIYSNTAYRRAQMAEYYAKTKEPSGTNCLEFEIDNYFPLRSRYRKLRKHMGPEETRGLIWDLLWFSDTYSRRFISYDGVIYLSKDKR
jgi:hypothetical protein